MGQNIELIVGLGNPGPQYADTRHNVGFWFAQALAKQNNVALQSEPKFKGKICSIQTEHGNCKLLTPSAFMNNSGEAITATASFYKISPEAILIVHDELDLAAGTIKLKFDGGHAGHNGLRSTISHLHSNQFYRLRIGIGHPGNKNQVTDYVLNKPSKTDKKLLLEAINRGINIIPELLIGEIDKATVNLQA